MYKRQHYVDETGVKLGNYFLRYPLKFTRISSVFSKSRFHPILKKSRPHNGVDFAAPTGTPVRSVGDGTVIDAGYRGGAGNMVKIKHNDKYSTAYLHLSKFAKGIKKGVKVSRGQMIGAVGKTGWATGPHLHFSLYIDNKYVDPFKVNIPKVSSSNVKAPEGEILNLVDELKTSHDDAKLALAEKKASKIS